MHIRFASLLVEDQSRALDFYTRVLGFVLTDDISMGEHRWLTVAAADGPTDLQLVLEPVANRAARVYQQSLFALDIPATAFEVDDIEAEHTRLTARGVVFTRPPAHAGPVSLAVFNDTCGNLIRLYQRRQDPRRDVAPEA